MTKIQWTEQTWNPIVGCTIATPGCTNCYAMKAAWRMGHNLNTPQYHGLTKKVNGNAVWTGKMNLVEKVLTQPLKRKKPTMYFVNSMGDLFHESVPDEWIDRVFAVMALCPQHMFQVLTKRADRMREYMTKPADHGRHITICDNGRSYSTPLMRARVHAEVCNLFPKVPPAALNAAAKWQDKHYPEGDGFIRAWPLPNVWLGVSVEDQTRADERIPLLLDTPAAVRFVSAEPLLGVIDLETAWHGESALDGECWGECGWCEKGYPPLHNCQRGKQSNADYQRGRDGLDWVIVGGESGPNARPMNPDWARSLRDQCVAAGVPFFMKQWGEYVSVSMVAGEGEHFKFSDGATVRRIGTKAAGNLIDGVEWQQMPEVKGE